MFRQAIIVSLTNNSPFKSIKRIVLGNGIWAILDQGFFSLSNFVINIILARWLSLQQYGFFATSFSVFLLVGTMHTAFLTEPMLIYGAGRYRDIYTEYLTNLLSTHKYFSIITSSLLLLISGIMYLLGQVNLAMSFTGLAVAQPFILLAWLLRRTSHTKFLPKIAAIAGAGYLVFIATGSYLLYSLSWLSPFSAFILMGISSLLVSVWMLVRIAGSSVLQCSGPLNKNMLELHIRYARWSIPSSVLTWIPTNLFYVTLPIVGNSEMVAVLRAQTNVLMPMLQFNTAIATHLIPTFVYSRGETAYHRLFLSYLLGLTLVAIIYYAGIYYLGDALLIILYGEKFSGYRWVLLVIGVLPVLTGVIAVLGARIRANDTPNQIFWAYLWASIFTVSFGMFLMFTRGLYGSALSIIISYLVVIAIMAYYLLCGKIRPKELRNYA